jgi:uncharacterized protein YjbI with pentapeptide repeats
MPNGAIAIEVCAALERTYRAHARSRNVRRTSVNLTGGDFANANAGRAKRANGGLVDENLLNANTRRAQWYDANVMDARGANFRPALSSCRFRRDYREGQSRKSYR